MTAAKVVLEPIFEADFSPVSFGFRPKRSAHQALEAIRVSANRGADWVLDADIKACFDEIDHDALMGQVERRVVDGEMLKLLRCWLRAGVFEGGVVADTETGTPQGSPISPLLANIALHVLDQAWKATAGLGTLVRYADDFVVLTTSRQRAEEARGRIEAVLASLGLRLHPDKTRIVYLGGGEDGFDFLAFHHRMTPSKWRRAICRSGLRRGPWPRFAPRSGIALNAASPAATCTTLSGISTPCCGAGAPTSDTELQSEVRPHRQLRALAAVEAGQRQIRHPRPTPPQPVQLWLAHRARHLPPTRNRPLLEHCACLTMNDVGEPRAGEPHARFDRGPLARKTLRRVA
jgi:hypothetical protein